MSIPVRDHSFSLLGQIELYCSFAKRRAKKEGWGAARGDDENGER